MSGIDTINPALAGAGAARAESAPAAPASPERLLVERVSADKVFGHVSKLAERPRVAGSPDHRAAANYVLDQLTQAGWNARLVEHASSWGPTLVNVVADRPGTAPEGERKLVFAGAHLDSVSRAPGANDNASGSATLIEVAKSFEGIDTKNDLRFIWFDGEERGLLGSRAYVRDYQAEAGRAVAMLNADMVGSQFGQPGFSLGGRTSPGVAQALQGVAERNGVKAVAYPERHARSDHDSFDRVGVPSIDIGVSVRTVDKDDPNYHSPRDTPDKINKSVLEGNADLLALGVYHFGNSTERITQPPAPRPVRPITGEPK